MTRWWQRRRNNPQSAATSGSQEDLASDRDGTVEVATLSNVRASAEHGDPEAMANLGVHYYQLGDHAQAIRWTERAWQAGNPGAGFNLGTFYLNSGDTHRADLVWTRAAELGDPDAMLCAARLALQRDDRSAANRWLDPLLGQDQPYPITALGVAYRDHGDPTTALRIFARSIALGDAYAMEYPARIHQHNGDTATASQLRARAAHSTRFGWGHLRLADDDGHNGSSA